MVSPYLAVFGLIWPHFAVLGLCVAFFGGIWLFLHDFALFSLFSLFVRILLYLALFGMFLILPYSA